MKIYKVNDILDNLEYCIKYKIPFSHIRFGDGGLKYIDSILNKDVDQLVTIVKKEGLPLSGVVDIFELWGYYTRKADFIDSPEVYFNGTFWPRIKKPGKPINKITDIKMRNWEELYSRAEFDNEHYCNPESNYLMVLRREGRRNLLDIMKNKRVCLITAKPKVINSLYDFDVDIVEIVAHYENQYKNSFEKVVSIIESRAKDYDFWMVAAGELGRLYSGIIKESGGRTVDIGFVVEFWLGEEIHPRLKSFLRRNCINPLELKLTDMGSEYDDYI